MCMHVYGHVHGHMSIGICVCTCMRVCVGHRQDLDASTFRAMGYIIIVYTCLVKAFVVMAYIAMAKQMPACLEGGLILAPLGWENLREALPGLRLGAARPKIGRGQA